MSDDERSHRSSRRGHDHEEDKPRSDDRRDRRKHSPERYGERRRSRVRSSDRSKKRDRSTDSLRARERDRSSDRHQRRRRHRSSSRRRERRRSRDDGSSDRRKRRSYSPRDSNRKDKSRHRRRHRKDDDDDDDEEAVEEKDMRKATTKRMPLQRSGPLPSQSDTFAVTTGGPAPPPEKERPNLKPTGILAALSNQITRADGSTTILKYHEPPEARKPAPRDQWRLFIFRGKGSDDVADTVELNGRSCWLVGRELAVVDLAAEHPSVSKQHAAVQFRYVERRNEFGERKGRVRPYLIDLESTQGTFLNGQEVEGGRYVEVRDKDVVRFGKSEREYVFMLARE